MSRILRGLRPATRLPHQNRPEGRQISQFNEIGPEPIPTPRWADARHTESRRRLHPHPAETLLQVQACRPCLPGAAAIFIRLRLLVPTLRERPAPIICIKLGRLMARHRMPHF